MRKTIIVCDTCGKEQDERLVRDWIAVNSICPSKIDVVKGTYCSFKCMAVAINNVVFMMTDETDLTAVAP